MIAALEPVEESGQPTPLRLPAAAEMTGAFLLLRVPRRPAADDMLARLAGDDGCISDERVAALFDELLALGGMTVIG